ncbi:MAG: hypothetical protein DSZ30_00800 [Aquificaceae bacterium]|nr:MAG: hypothetical protein DSZ30_00800 [Aquificaceae bacterium]
MIFALLQKIVFDFFHLKRISVSKILNIVMRILFFILQTILVQIVYALNIETKKFLAEIPFLPTHIKPLVVIDMDFSGSMQFPAYYYCRFLGYYRSKVAECGIVYGKYNKNKKYYGYFDPNSCYIYNNAGGYWEKNNCNCSSNGGIGNKNCLSGNFLNWLISSRIDIALKALIGGKAYCENNFCVLRPQGARRIVRIPSLHCSFLIEANRYWSGNYVSKDIIIFARNYGGTCKLGNWSRYAKVKVPLAKRKGILQKIFDKIDITFILFNSYGHYGEVKYAFYEKDLNKLVSALEKAIPYWGTPTGESLWEVWDYLAQKNLHGYESNSLYIGRGTSKDPYYSETYKQFVPCRKTFVLLISDGEWNGKVDPAEVAYKLHTSDLRKDIEGTQKADVFTLFVFSSGSLGKNSMATVASCGGFEDLNGDGKPSLVNCYYDSRLQHFPIEDCFNCSCKEWDKNCDGYPDNFFYAQSGKELESALTQIFTKILSVSGTAVSLPATERREGSGGGISYGSVVTQATFQELYQKDRAVHWIGHIYNWWLWVGNGISNIREDTVHNFVLDAIGTQGVDRILEWSFDDKENTLLIKACQPKEDGSPSSDCTVYKGYENLTPTVDFGEVLKDTSADDRTIYINIDGVLDTLDYDKLDKLLFAPYKGVITVPLLGVPDVCDPYSFLSECLDFNKDSWDVLGCVYGKVRTCVISHLDYYYKLIDWIKGRDFEDFRIRTPQGLLTSTGEGVWKLGDIVYSTPIVVDYGSFRVAFVGSNDGMLHAFRLGYIKNNYNIYRPIALQNGEKDTATDLIGQELWAFIPTHALPYLGILADKEYGLTSNKHLYLVDLSPYVVKEGNRLILIGGFRLGGATGFNGEDALHPPSYSCPATLWETVFLKCRRLISSFPALGNIWKQFCSTFNIKPSYDGCYGLSEYFALDITDPLHPQLLWEFTHPQLGLSYSGPGIVRKKDKTYVVFLSGFRNPTAEVSQNAINSELNLYAFVLELNTGKLVRVLKINIGKPAFGGRLFKEGFDYNGDGETDYLIFGYSKPEGNPQQWKGGLIALDVRDENPENWKAIRIGGDINPVVSKVEVGFCFGKPYLYFGTGRWFFKTDDLELHQNNYIYGIPFTCDQNGCRFPENPNGAVDVTDESRAEDVCREYNQGHPRAWKIRLNPEEGIYLREKDISDPIKLDNVVLFTTTQPTASICSLGSGRSRVWKLHCALGSSVGQDFCPSLKIKNVEQTFFLQTSTSQIVKLTINSSNAKERVSLWYSGIAPESGVSVMKTAPKLDTAGRILLWLEY